MGQKNISRRLRLRRKNKTRRVKKQRGGGQFMSIEEIRTSIKNDNFEICGRILEGNRLYKDADGPPKVEGTRASCHGPNARKIWHTHPHVSKYYPSFEDINSVLKYPKIEDSYIYTVFGFWHLHYIGEKIKLDEKQKNDIKDALNFFYSVTGTGRSYNIDEITALITEIRLLLPVDISWTDWTTENGF
jgi:hypothetical protein